MPTEIIMPKLSDTMEEGTILRWLKHTGDRIEKGDVVAEVETDKADMELEASTSGTLTEIRVQEGDSVAVGAVLAVVGEEDGSAPATGARADGEARRAGTERGATSTAERRPVPPPTRAAKPAPPPAHRESTLASPAAPPHTKWTPHPSAPLATQPREREALSKVRLAVAKQMTASKRDVPHFYVTAEIDMSEVTRLRASLTAADSVPERITFTHFIIRAVALTLPRHPRLNASWSDGAIEYHTDINIGIAVAVDDGLIAPVLRGCNHLSLRAVAAATNNLVEKAQSGRFSGDGLTGATFTISNLGMLDVDAFSAVITPPQAAILAVGAIKDRPVVRNGELAVGKTMRVTLSLDHRVLNGVEAGRFLEDLKRTLENPAPLLLADEPGLRP